MSENYNIFSPFDYLIRGSKNSKPKDPFKQNAIENKGFGDTANVADLPVVEGLSKTVQESNDGLMNQSFDSTNKTILSNKITHASNSSDFKIKEIPNQSFVENSITLSQTSIVTGLPLNQVEGFPINVQEPNDQVISQCFDTKNLSLGLTFNKILNGANPNWFENTNLQTGLNSSIFNGEIEKSVILFQDEAEGKLDQKISLKTKTEFDKKIKDSSKIDKIKLDTEKMYYNDSIKTPRRVFIERLTTSVVTFTMISVILVSGLSLLFSGMLTTMPSYLQACTTSNPCMASLTCNGTCYCNGTSYWNGVTCKSFLLYGSNCTASSQCANSLICLNNSLCQCTSNLTYTNGQCQ